VGCISFFSAWMDNLWFVLKKYLDDKTVILHSFKCVYFYQARCNCSYFVVYILSVHDTENTIWQFGCFCFWWWVSPQLIKALNTVQTKVQNGILNYLMKLDDFNIAMTKHDVEYKCKRVSYLPSPYQHVDFNMAFKRMG